MRFKPETEGKAERNSAPPPAATTKKFQVIIADENPVCRRGLRDLLGKDPRFEIVAELEDGEALFETIVEKQPDVAVLDSTLPGLNGVELAALLKASEATTNLVMIASQSDEDAFNQAINAGVKGYVLKKSSEHELLDCIATTAAGGAYVSPALTDFLLRRHSSTERLRGEQPGLIRLTFQERRIINRIAQGKTSRQIAIECGISLRTVDSHRANICEKLGLNGRHRLLQFALQHRDALNHLDS
jgi:DNA-binding NarL/FixJ family response regulator